MHFECWWAYNALYHLEACVYLSKLVAKIVNAKDINSLKNELLFNFLLLNVITRSVLSMHSVHRFMC